MDDWRRDLDATLSITRQLEPHHLLQLYGMLERGAARIASTLDEPRGGWMERYHLGKEVSRLAGQFYVELMQRLINPDGSYSGTAYLNMMPSKEAWQTDADIEDNT